MSHTTIRKVRIETGTGGYRKVQESDYERQQRRGALRLDGVDGDERRNTVTYYYTRDAR